MAARARTPRRIARAAGALALAAVAVLGACGRTAARTDLPEGTVIVFAGQALTAAEVDAVAERLRPLSPSFSQPHLRRLALTNVFFPLLTARAGAGEEREEARRRAEEASAEWAEGRAQGPLPDEEGAFPTLGIELWMQLAELEPGEWTPVFEVPGGFVLARLVERDRAPRAPAEQFRASVLRFAYEGDRAAIEQRVFEQELEIVDPEWERIVPGTWKTRMDGGS